MDPTTSEVPSTPAAESTPPSEVKHHVLAAETLHVQPESVEASEPDTLLETAMGQNPALRQYITRMRDRVARHDARRNQRVNETVGRLQRLVNRRGVGGLIREVRHGDAPVTYLWIYNAVMKTEDGNTWTEPRKVDLGAGASARRALQQALKELR